MTRPAKAQQESSVLLVEIHDLHMPAVGGNVGPQSVEGAFDSIKNVHADLEIENSYVPGRNIAGS